MTTISSLNALKFRQNPDPTPAPVSVVRPPVKGGPVRIPVGMTPNQRLPIGGHVKAFPLKPVVGIAQPVTPSPTDIASAKPPQMGGPVTAFEEPTNITKPPLSGGPVTSINDQLASAPGHPTPAVPEDSASPNQLNLQITGVKARGISLAEYGIAQPVAPSPTGGAETSYSPVNELV